MLGAAGAAVLLAAACTSSGHDLPAAARPTLAGTVPVATPDPPLLAVPPAAPAPPTGATVDVPGSIVDDCSADVSVALNQFVHGVADGSTIRFAANGCYRVDGTLELDGRRNLTLDGRGAQLRAVDDGNRDRRHVRITGSTDITVRGLTIVGSNGDAGANGAAYQPDRAFQHAFDLDGDTRVELDGVRATRLHGDFVYIGALKDRPSTDVTVIHSQFDGSGRQGISITDGVRILVADDSIIGAARSMFDLEANAPSAVIRDVRITGTHTGAAVNFWLADKGSDAQIGPVEIDHDVMDASTGGLFFVFGQTRLRGPWAIHDNTFIASDAVHDEDSVGAFLFAHAYDVALVRNRVTFRDSMPAVELRASEHVRVLDDVFAGASRPLQADGSSIDVVSR